MKIINQHRNAGFSLIEVLVSTVLLSIVAVGAFSSMSLARLMREQDREIGIMNDFSVHYAETIKALPFDDLQPGVPLSGHWDGASQGPLVSFPEQFLWTSLGTPNYVAFHPGLQSVLRLDPQIRVGLIIHTNESSSMQKWTRIEVRWNGTGQTITTKNLRTDLLRIPGM